MSRKTETIRICIYAVMVIALLLTAFQYSRLPKGAEPITIPEAEEPTGGSAELTVDEEPPAVTLEGFQTDVTVDVGYSYSIDPVIKTENGAGIPEPVYESDDESVVTVDAEGNITAIAPGTATVTVKAGSAEEEIIVRVN